LKNFDLVWETQVAEQKLYLLSNRADGLGTDLTNLCKHIDEWNKHC